MRALVLGGGGMFGAFQAGAWTVLEKNVKFDCVVGASAGSLNAWAVAGGVSGEQLESLWLTAGDDLSVKLRVPRYWMDGVLENQALDALVRRLVAECQPRLRLGVAVTEAWLFRRKLYTDAEIGAEHLLASCAVPFLLPAKCLNGRLSIDGGIRNACPVWGAWEMGADQAVAVDVWAHLPWWWPLPEPDREGSGALQWIVPPHRPGPLRTSMFWEKSRIEEWIELGRMSAQLALPGIERRFARK